MFPHKTGILKFHSTKEALRTFEEHPVLQLKSKLNVDDKAFTLVKKRTFLNPFDRKMLFGEIRCEIAENQISYDIRVSDLMKYILLLDGVVLVVIALSQLLDNEFQLGFLLLSIGVIFALITYFWINTEIYYLEKVLKKALG